MPEGVRTCDDNLGRRGSEFRDGDSRFRDEGFNRLFIEVIGAP